MDIFRSELSEEGSNAISSTSYEDKLVEQVGRTAQY
jgi:hypothetical protein